MYFCKKVINLSVLFVMLCVIGVKTITITITIIKNEKSKSYYCSRMSRMDIDG